MRKLLLLPLLACTLIASACGGDSTGPGEESVAGTYTLKTVGGASLPATIVESAAGRVDVTAGSLNLNADQTFSGTISLRAVSGSTTQTETDQLTGTYQRNNNALLFTYSDGSQDSGSVSGRQVTVIDSADGIVLLFER